MNIFELPIHPAAEKFPMLAQDELAELAEDIKANGLNNPIVVKDGVLIDGRNRREACRLAGIEPATIELNGQDPIAYILSSNINRRHMTKGQRAMAVAMIYPELPGQGKKDEAGNVAETATFSASRLRQARTVLRWCPELAPAVLEGKHPLDRAYDEAADRKLRAEGINERIEALRASDPDLADKVVEDSLSLSDAEGAAKQRRTNERAARQGIYSAIGEVERWAFLFNESHRAMIARLCAEHPNEINRAKVLALFRALAADLSKAIAIVELGEDRHE